MVIYKILAFGVLRQKNREVLSFPLVGKIQIKTPGDSEKAGEHDGDNGTARFVADVTQNHDPRRIKLFRN